MFGNFYFGQAYPGESIWPTQVQISGTIAGTSTVSGSLTGTGNISGVSTGTATLSGAMTGAGILSGASSGSSVCSGSIGESSNELSGSIQGTCSVSATLIGTGLLSGSTSGSCAVAGTGTLTTATGQTFGRPQRWTPLIPADWPMPKRVQRNASVEVGSIELVCSRWSDAEWAVGSMEAAASIQLATVSIDSTWRIKPMLIEVNVGQVTARAIRNPTDAELAMILLNV
jgi:hypothetical protein